MIVKTITPLHIGTGATKMSFQYKSVNDEYACYDLADLLSTMPIKNMMDEKFLSSLSDSNNNKNILTEQFKRYVEYRKIHPTYHCLDGVAIENQDVYEQVKSITTPIIPGSSIKGAILNAIYYYFLKQHLYLIKNDIMHNTNKYELLDEKYYLRLILGLDKNEISTFLRTVSSSLMCSDIPFSTLEIAEAFRVFKSKKPMPMGCLECISPNQEVNGNFIQFNENNCLLKEYKAPIQREFIDCFKIKNLYKACNVYFTDMLSIESTKYIQNLYKNNKMNEINQLVLQLQKEALNSNHCYLRLGKNTNYFFKSLTGLFKKEVPDFYQKNFELFKPSSRNLKANINFEMIPSTRVALKKSDKYTLSGFVELEFDV